jgi:hypothetical protein
MGKVLKEEVKKLFGGNKGSAMFQTDIKGNFG